LAQQRNQPNFGNGGAVANLLASAIGRMNSRVRGEANVGDRAAALANELIPEDFDPNYGKPPQSEDSIFSGLVGCDKIILKLREYQATINMDRVMGQDPIANGILELNFLFVGPHGILPHCYLHITNLFERSWENYCGT
jgi:hypothetical protein